MKRNQSAILFEEAKKIFPGGVNSPVRAFKSVEGPPLFMVKGEGSKLWDEDGNQFIDYCCSWGPLILGHNDPDVKRSIIQVVENGTSFGTPTRHGNHIGLLITENHRYLEKLRFVSSGTEAVMSAIRLARGYTKRNKLIKFEGCYHGHVDSMMVKAGSGLATLGVSTSAGIPPGWAADTIVLPLNDLQTLHNILRAQGEEIAAVIMEPVPANHGLLLQDKNYLEWIRKLCDDYGVLLIFDEVISGFRLGFEGATGYYSIQPDIITFGKIIGGGLPVGAYGGSAEIMSFVSPDGPVYQAGTLSANPVTLAAGYTTLKKLLVDGFYESLEKKTSYLANKVNSECQSLSFPVRIQHIESIFWISFSEERIITSDQIDPMAEKYFKKLHSKLLNKGIYLGPSVYEVGFISSAHSYEDLDYTIESILQTLQEIF
ncbi:MAG TPA: glutamate-1-semialdehyde 2,1-aminomutase [Saprospiraceae bacterium]|nr:glutamate-1-semialdehyde 2,1-aminomutase [Saprospiraceae bacterium]